MKNRLIILLTLNFLITITASYAELKKAQVLAEDLPKIFWYTAKKWEELEKTPSLYEGYEYFCKTRACKLVGEQESESHWKYYIYYSDSSEPEGDGWEFVFRLDESVWHEVSAVRKSSGMTIGLLKDDFASPGMKPQLKEALSLYNEGKLEQAIKELDGPRAATLAPSYIPLVGEKGAGSGFHFQSGENIYIACSLHQFGGEIPKLMHSSEFESPVLIAEQVKRGEDIQILTFTSNELDALAPLKFEPNFEPSVGEEIYIYCNDGEKVARARIDTLAKDGSCLASTREPYQAGGMSGSPIVSAVNNLVIGVLVGADSATDATSVTFELLYSKREKKK